MNMKLNDTSHPVLNTAIKQAESHYGNRLPPGTGVGSEYALMHTSDLEPVGKHLRKLDTGLEKSLKANALLSKSVSRRNNVIGVLIVFLAAAIMAAVFVNCPPSGILIGLIVVSVALGGTAGLGLYMYHKLNPNVSFEEMDFRDIVRLAREYDADPSDKNFNKIVNNITKDTDFNSELVSRASLNKAAEDKDDLSTFLQKHTTLSAQTIGHGWDSLQHFANARGLNIGTFVSDAQNNKLNDKTIAEYYKAFYDDYEKLSQDGNLKAQFKNNLAGNYNPQLNDKQATEQANNVLGYTLAMLNGFHDYLRRSSTKSASLLGAPNALLNTPGAVPAVPPVPGGLLGAPPVPAVPPVPGGLLGAGGAVPVPGAGGAGGVPYPSGIVRLQGLNQEFKAKWEEYTASEGLFNRKTLEASKKVAELQVENEKKIGELKNYFIENGGNFDGIKINGVRISELAGATSERFKDVSKGLKQLSFNSESVAATSSSISTWSVEDTDTCLNYRPITLEQGLFNTLKEKFKDIVVDEKVAYRQGLTDAQSAIKNRITELENLIKMADKDRIKTADNGATLDMLQLQMSSLSDMLLKINADIDNNK